MTSVQKQHRLQVVIAFALVYVVWGSTYLAMRVAVEHIPPFVMGAVRYLVAGPVMLAYCAWSGRKIKLTRGDTFRLIAISVSLLTVGNMGVAWSEVYLPSGMTALLAAGIPIWVAILQAWIFRSSRLSWMGFAGLTLGIGGMVVLLWPQVTAAAHVGRPVMIGAAIVIAGSVGWAMGSVLAGRWSLSIDVFASSGWQMVIGGTSNLLIALASGQFHHTEWTLHATMAVVYLVIFGSWIGFSAYCWLLEHVPTPKVATYAYVNPVVAVYLGWLFLDEKVDRYMLAGTVIIVAAVALVNLSKLKALRTHPEIIERDLVAVEPAGD